MLTADSAFAEFTTAWKAGRRPRVHEFLDRTAPSDHDAFLELVGIWMDVAATPEYDDATYAQIAAAPEVSGVVDAVRNDGTLWPEVLPKLRQRRGMSLRELATAVVKALGVDGGETRAEHWLGRMETDDVDPRGVSRRLLDAIATALETSVETLASAGDVANWTPVPTARLMWRADAPDQAELGRHLDVLMEVAAAAPSRREGPEETIDRMFTGGREA